MHMYEKNHTEKTAGRWSRTFAVFSKLLFKEENDNKTGLNRYFSQGEIADTSLLTVLTVQESSTVSV